MQDVVQVSAARRATVVTPGAAGMPAAQAAADSSGNPTNVAGTVATGFYNLMSDVLTPGFSVAAGVPKTFLLVPFAKDANTTWTVVVYGFKQVGPVWRPICLYKASCVCDIAITGDQTLDSTSDLDNNDKMASAITPSTTFPAGAADTTSVGSAEPGSVEIKSRGCPYLFVTGSSAAGRVAIAPPG